MKYLILTLLTTTLISGICFSQNAKHKIIKKQTPAVTTSSDSREGIAKDIDGNEYPWIKIGNQKWMVENLRTTHFRNGDKIPYLISNSDWTITTSPAFCIYGDLHDNLPICGALYNGYAVQDKRKIAPVGWHVASKNDWEVLVKYLIANGYNADDSSLSNKVGKALADSIGWNENNGYCFVGCNQSQNNKTGFTARPTGYRDIFGGMYAGLHRDAKWWTSSFVLRRTQEGSMAYFAYFANLKDFSASLDIELEGFGLRYGYSVRCVKDN